MASTPETPAAATDLISFLKALPDCRMRRGIRFPQWFMPLLEPLPARLDLLRLQIRLQQDFHLIAVGRSGHASRLLDGVGRQLTGWLGQQRQTP